MRKGYKRETERGREKGGDRDTEGEETYGVSSYGSGWRTDDMN